MIRFATPEDSHALRNIYAQYINTAVTFEYTLPTKQEFSRRIEGIAKLYPYLVCEENKRVIGYTYANRYQEREAYQWNAELSVYIDGASLSQGLGGRFYQILIEILKVQGIKTVYGIVAVPNERSEKLHQSFDFNRIGTYHHAGYKCGVWHDVALFEKEIADYDEKPTPFKPFCEIAESVLDSIVRKYT